MSGCVGGVLPFFFMNIFSPVPLEIREDVFAPDDILALCSLNKEEEMETLPPKCDPLRALPAQAPTDWD